MTQKEYKELVKKAIKAREAYYVLSAPMMSDSEYDALERQIFRVERDNPGWIMATSPSQTVGFSYSGGSKMGHKSPMLSVKKAYGMEELAKACDKMKASEYCIEWKYDGISCSLVYEGGELVQAGTRGDGIVGQDITDVVYGMNDVPKHIRFGGRVEVRGEICMSEQTYNRYFDGRYPDGRNAASTLALSNNAENGKYLSFRAWQGMGEAFAGVNRQSERLQKVASLGFKVPEFHVVSSMDDMARVIERMSDEAPGISLYVDGIVIKVNDITRWVELGATKTSPKYAVAYKWDCVKVQVRVTEIEMREAESGRVTPIVWFKPVEIDGVYYDHVSGGSVKSICAKGITENCVVEVGLQGGTSIKLFGVVEGANDSCDDESNDRCVDGSVQNRNEKKWAVLSAVAGVVVTVAKVFFLVGAVCLCGVLGGRLPSVSVE